MGPSAGRRKSSSGWAGSRGIAAPRRLHRQLRHVGRQGAGCRVAARPYERRRWPDSERASGAIDYFVEQRGDDVVFGYEIYDDEVFLRILGLNYGIGGSFMEPTGNWPLSNGVPKALAWPDDSPKGYRSQTQVNHPGHGGYDFLDEARQEALNEYVRRLRT